MEVQLQQFASAWLGITRGIGTDTKGDNPSHKGRSGSIGRVLDSGSKSTGICTGSTQEDRKGPLTVVMGITVYRCL